MRTRLHSSPRSGKLTSVKLLVAYSSDENYVKLTAVSAVSLLMCHPDDDVTVIFLANAVASQSLDLLRHAVESHGGMFISIDVESALASVASAGASGYTSFSAYARLFLPTFLDGKAERVLYLDSDTLVADRLDGLFTMDLQGKAFAIGYDCLCNQYKKMIGLPADKPYFNSGVLLIDVKEWLRRQCTERIFRYMQEVRAAYLLGDQDFFSLVLADDGVPLSPRYNYLTHFFLFTTYRGVLRATGIPSCAWASRVDYEKARQAPAVYHFLGHTLGRPWFKESRHPMRRAFVDAAVVAGVPEVTEQSRPMEFHYRLQERLHRLLPRVLFVEAARLMYRYFFWHTYHV